jgi:hypothetical protein
MSAKELQGSVERVKVEEPPEPEGAVVLFYTKGAGFWQAYTDLKDGGINWMAKEAARIYGAENVRLVRLSQPGKGKMSEALERVLMIAEERAIILSGYDGGAERALSVRQAIDTVRKEFA